MKNWVDEALEELPATWGAVLLERFARRRPRDAVAESLGLSADQERAVVRQALADLRARLGDDR